MVDGDKKTGDDAQVFWMVRKGPGRCSNVREGAQMSGKVHKCLGMSTKVRDGAQISRMVRKCPERCSNVREGPGRYTNV